MEINLTAVLGIIFVFGIPIVAICSLAMYLINRDKSKTHLRESIINNGITDNDIIHELLRNQDGAKNDKNNFTMEVGMMLMCAGVGAIAGNEIYGDDNYLMFSFLVAMFAGMGLLIAFYIEMRLAERKRGIRKEEPDEKQMSE